MNKNKLNFSLKSPETVIKSAENNESVGLFEVTDIANKTQKVRNIAIENLRSFKNHPFKLYEGERFADMVESVRENGVISPIIARPIVENEDETYEILAGHNRVEVAKTANLEYVPCIIRTNLSDDEALLIVTETNLIQRSFTDLSHSERALTLATRHLAIKRQGKRTDLIQEIEDLLKNNSDNFDQSSPMGNKLKTMAKVGREYDLSKNTVARYLRINQLSSELKKRLDCGEFAVRAAVEISYLNEEEQQILNETLENSAYKLDMKKAEFLRSYKENSGVSLDVEVIEDILSGIEKEPESGAKPPKITLKPKFLSQFFDSSKKADEIEAEIAEALEFWRENKNNKTIN